MKVYALLIAIDTYRSPVPALNGCVRDSLDVKAYLEANVDPDVLMLKTLHNEEATKAHIIEGFLSHLGQAIEEDVVFVHYSGHGSQEKSPPEFWHLEPDRMNETMVCVDSRQVIDGVYHRDLSDKELGALIYQVSKNKPHIVVMLDCCHSGSGSRDSAEVTPRQSPADGAKTRALEDYVFLNRPEFGEEYKELFAKKKEVTLPVGPHIILSGCKNVQTAKELSIAGKTGGIFTYSILEALKSSRGNLSYRDLLRRASAFVRNKVADQDPLLEEVNINPLVQKVVGAPVKADANQQFLFGSSRPKEDYYFVSYDKKMRSWIVEAGAMHGIPTPQVTEKPTLAIYDQDANVTENPDSFFAEAEIVSVEASYSKITFPGSDSTLSLDANFKAVLLNVPMSRLRVRLEAEDPASTSQQEGLRLLHESVAGSRANKHALRYLQEVRAEEETDYRVRAYEEKGKEKYSIHRVGDNLPLIRQVPGFSERSADEIAQQLTGIARWDRTLNLTNPGTRIAPGEVEIEVFKKDRDPQSGEVGEEERIFPDDNGEIVLPYYTYDPVDDDDLGASPAVRIRVTNHSSSKTYQLALFYMGSNFSVENLIYHVKELGPGQSAYAIEGEFFAPEVAEELQNLGMKQDASVLKLLVSTSHFDASEFEQEGFEYPQETRGLRRKGSSSATDWTTDQVTITAVVADTSADEQVLAQAGVTVQRPEGVGFEVALTSLSNSTRSVASDLLPASVLTDDPSLMQPFTYVQGRSTTPNLNVLELRGIDHPEMVTRENPLVIEFDQPLAEGESLMAVTTDGELMYPVIATRTAEGKARLQLDSLTAPASRSLSSTFRLMVHKVFAGKFGVAPFPYPRLMAVSQKGNKTHYEYDEGKISAAVAEAEKIVVCVHGFIGDAHGTFFQATESDGEDSFFHVLAERYDLVLAFDYESYNTRISSNAAGLQRRLKEAGLTLDHDKQVHLMVHSMGGLIARYFIEMLEGKRMVQHLFMFGTPNGGSPWSKVKDWALFGSSLLLNAIPVVGWAISGLSYLVNIAGAVDGLDQVTDDMKPGSPLIRDLDQCDDPGVKYTIYAGTLPFGGDDAKSKVTRILDRIGVDEGMKRFLFKEENDLAVGTQSIKAVSVTRDPKPSSKEVACNHFAYFSDPEVIRNLKYRISLALD